MTGIVSLIFDIVLIGLLVPAIVYAVRLLRQLASLRASRAEMERFIADFGMTVHRAESGIQGLKLAARTAGDDLEKLIEKAATLRDELHFLTESADQIASRLSDSAALASKGAAGRDGDGPAPRGDAVKAAPDPGVPADKAAMDLVKQVLAAAEKETMTSSSDNSAPMTPAAPPARMSASRAEKDLMEALGKMTRGTRS